MLTASKGLSEVHVLYLEKLHLYKLYETPYTYDDICVDAKQLMLANQDKKDRKLYLGKFEDLVGVDFYETVWCMAKNQKIIREDNCTNLIQNSILIPL